MDNSAEVFIVPITPVSRPIETLYLGDDEMTRYVTGLPSHRTRGTLFGVLVPTCEFMWSVLLFVRFGYIAGEAGVLGSLMLLLVCLVTMMLTATSVFALATNGIPQGGMYKILEQSLGKGAGGSISAFYYLGIIALVGVEIVGSVESLMEIETISLVGNVYYDKVIICLGSLFFCYALSITGPKTCKNISAIFLGILLVSFLSLFIGLFTSFRKVGLPGYEGVHSFSFKLLLENLFPLADFSTAFLVPCFIGIYSGVHHADHLIDPFHSIPLGGCSALALSFSLYSTLIVVFNAVAERNVLVSDEMIGPKLSFPSPHFAAIGIYVVGLGAAFQSILIGMDILKAVKYEYDCYENYLKQSHFIFPLFTILLASPLMFVDNLEYLSELATMAFLLCYSSTNLACYLLSSFQSPFWRPEFKKSGAAFSLSGFVLTVALMFMIRWYAAFLIIIIAIMAAYFIHNSSTDSTFGLGLQNMMFHGVLKYLVSSEQQKINEDLKNYTENLSGDSISKLAGPYFTDVNFSVETWRPRILAFVEFSPGGNMLHPNLIPFISQLAGPNNLCFLANVVSIDKDYEKIERKETKLKNRNRLPKGVNERYLAVREIILERKAILQKRIQNENLLAFAKVLSAPDQKIGQRIFLQTVGLGLFAPNTVVASWPTDNVCETKRQWLNELQELWLLVSRQDLALVLCKGIQHFPATEEVEGYIDVWWIEKEAQLLLLVAYLLKKSYVWRKCQIRLFVMCHSTDNPVVIEEELRLYLSLLRLTINLITVVPVELTDVRLSAEEDVPVSLKRWREELVRLHETNLMTISERYPEEAVEEIMDEFGGTGIGFPQGRRYSVDFHGKERLMVADLKVLQELKTTIEEYSKNSCLVILNMPVPTEIGIFQPKSLFRKCKDLLNNLRYRFDRLFVTKFVQSGHGLFKFI